LTSAPKRPDGTPIWYGRRSSHKLRPGRRRLMDELLPRVQITPLSDGAKINLDDVFGTERGDLHLEIGFGGGEHLSGCANAAPETSFIGCEPFIDGVASLLADVEELGLENVRVFSDDARILLEALPDGCLSRTYLLFPDPWPKKRHNRRRLVGPEFLTTLARLSADKAEFLFASDHMGYVAWTLAEVHRHPDWTWTARRPADWRDPPPDWVETRYEAKARKKGDLPAYLSFRRRPR